jgi:hypothetical protein
MGPKHQLTWLCLSLSLSRLSPLLLTVSFLGVAGSLLKFPVSAFGTLRQAHAGGGLTWTSQSSQASLHGNQIKQETVLTIWTVE